MRNKLIEKINEFGIAKNWKVILDVEEDSEKIRLAFYKKTGLVITFFKRTFTFFPNWRLVRKVTGFSYTDLFDKLEKYPFLLETEKEFIND